MNSRRLVRLTSMLVLLMPWLPVTTAAQSLTAGRLVGRVQTPAGEPVAGASVTLEGEVGNPITTVETDSDGRVRLPLVATGRYRILVEQPGFQPIRLHGVPASGGRTTSFLAILERRPPPIERVLESNAATVQTGGDLGIDASTAELSLLDARLDLTDYGRQVSAVVPSSQGASGFGVASNGVTGNRTRLLVDGVEEFLIRHPGLPGLPATAPAFSRLGLAETTVLPTRSDVEWRPAAGALLVGHTRRGANRTTLTPYGTFSSSSLAGRPRDNPGDSSASSFQVGMAIAGAIRPDTAHYFLSFDFQSIEQPSQSSWYRTESTFAGSAVDLAATLRALGADSFGTDLNRVTRPALRSWKGSSGLGRLDLALSARHQAMVRAAFASWKERAPLVDDDLTGGVAGELDGRDVSAVVSLASNGGSLSNELRLGFATSRRDWRSSTLPVTTLLDDGISLGGPSYGPARFDQRHLDVVESFQLARGAHRVKAGFGVRAIRYEQRYAFGTTPLVWYSNLDDLAAAQGAAFHVSGAEAVSFSVAEPAVFLQDVVSVSPEIDLLLGLRYETMVVAKDAVRANAEWAGLTGVPTGLVPKGKSGWSPRGELAWDVRGSGRTVVRAGAGLSHERTDLAQVAEAAIFDGAARVQRAFGDLSVWPNVASGTGLNSSTRLTLFSDRFRAPRAFQANASVSQSMGSGARLTLSGHYVHTDFLLRRTDLNLTSAGKSVDGRPVFGSIVKIGSVLGPVPGSNRRFGSFDHVFWLAPTGFADHYELTGSLERRLTPTWNAFVSYTWSKTKDNLLGALSADPADQLNPLPDGVDGRAWDEGRSDLDIPHRVTGMVEYRSSGRTAFSIGVRGRYRSGFPFTPGYPAGVDVNGDGSLANDPAYLANGLAGLSEALRNGNCQVAAGGFAVRNSCRAKASGSLDVRVGVTLRMPGSERALRLTVDGFNLLATQSGIVDRAILLVDRDLPVTVDQAGAWSVPTKLNPRFGTLLGFRGGVRWLRAGLQVEY